MHCDTSNIANGTKKQQEGPKGNDFRSLFRSQRLVHHYRQPKSTNNMKEGYASSCFLFDAETVIPVQFNATNVSH